MTPRHLWLHFHAGCAVALTFVLAVIAGFYVLPKLAADQRVLWSAVVGWQVLMALILGGAGVSNMRWGFITARPMWLMTVASMLTIWLIPLGIWAYRAWRDEKIYKKTWHLQLREERLRYLESQKEESASKLPPDSEIQ